jgi:hypothetical protein
LETRAGQHEAATKHQRGSRGRDLRLPIGSNKSETNVVQFRDAKIAESRVISPCDQHLAVGQQRRRVQTACGGEAASVTPNPAGRVVEFRDAKIADGAGVLSRCHQHLAVGQQGRRVIRLIRGIQLDLGDRVKRRLSEDPAPAAYSAVPKIR